MHITHHLANSMIQMYRRWHLTTSLVLLVSGFLEDSIAADSVLDSFCRDRDDGIFSHPHSCSQFVKCGGGVAYVQHCSADLHFNPRINVCDHPMSALCQLQGPHSSDINLAYEDIDSEYNPHLLEGDSNGEFVVGRSGLKIKEIEDLEDGVGTATMDETLTPESSKGYFAEDTQQLEIQTLPEKDPFDTSTARHSRYFLRHSPHEWSGNSAKADSGSRKTHTRDAKQKAVRFMLDRGEQLPGTQNDREYISQEELARLKHMDGYLDFIPNADMSTHRPRSRNDATHHRTNDHKPHHHVDRTAARQGALLSGTSVSESRSHPMKRKKEPVLQETIYGITPQGSLKAHIRAYHPKDGTYTERSEEIPSSYIGMKSRNKARAYKNAQLVMKLQRENNIKQKIVKSVVGEPEAKRGPPRKPPPTQNPRSPIEENRTTLPPRQMKRRKKLKALKRKPEKMLEVISEFRQAPSTDGSGFSLAPSNPQAPQIYPSEPFAQQRNKPNNNAFQHNLFPPFTQGPQAAPVRQVGKHGGNNFAHLFQLQQQSNIPRAPHNVMLTTTAAPRRTTHQPIMSVLTPVGLHNGGQQHSVNNEIKRNYLEAFKQYQDPAKIHTPFDTAMKNHERQARLPLDHISHRVNNHPIANNNYFLPNEPEVKQAPSSFNGYGDSPVRDRYQPYGESRNGNQYPSDLPPPPPPPDDAAYPKPPSQEELKRLLPRPYEFKPNEYGRQPGSMDNREDYPTQFENSRQPYHKNHMNMNGRSKFPPTDPDQRPHLYPNNNNYPPQSSPAGRYGPRMLNPDSGYSSPYANVNPVEERIYDPSHDADYPSAEEDEEEGRDVRQYIHDNYSKPKLINYYNPNSKAPSKRHGHANSYSNVHDYLPRQPPSSDAADKLSRFNMARNSNGNDNPVDTRLHYKNKPQQSTNYQRYTAQERDNTHVRYDSGNDKGYDSNRYENSNRQGYQQQQRDSNQQHYSHQRENDNQRYPKRYENINQHQYPRRRQDGSQKQYPQQHGNGNQQRYQRHESGNQHQQRRKNGNQQQDPQRRENGNQQQHPQRQVETEYQRERHRPDSRGERQYPNSNNGYHSPEKNRPPPLRYGRYPNQDQTGRNEHGQTGQKNNDNEASEGPQGSHNSEGRDPPSFDNFPFGMLPTHLMGPQFDPGQNSDQLTDGNKSSSPQKGNVMDMKRDQVNKKFEIKKRPAFKNANFVTTIPRPTFPASLGKSNISLPIIQLHTPVPQDHFKSLDPITAVPLSMSPKKHTNNLRFTSLIPTKIPYTTQPIIIKKAKGNRRGQGNVGYGYSSPKPQTYGGIKPQFADSIPQLDKGKPQSGQQKPGNVKVYESLHPFSKVGVLPGQAYPARLDAFQTTQQRKKMDNLANGIYGAVNFQIPLPAPTPQLNNHSTDAFNYPDFYDNIFPHKDRVSHSSTRRHSHSTKFEQRSFKSSAPTNEQPNHKPVIKIQTNGQREFLSTSNYNGKESTKQKKDSYSHHWSNIVKRSVENIPESSSNKFTFEHLNTISFEKNSDKSSDTFLSKQSLQEALMRNFTNSSGSWISFMNPATQGGSNRTHENRIDIDHYIKHWKSPVDFPEWLLHNTPKQTFHAIPWNTSQPQKLDDEPITSFQFPENTATYSNSFKPNFDSFSIDKLSSIPFPAENEEQSFPTLPSEREEHFSGEQLVDHVHGPPEDDARRGRLNILAAPVRSPSSVGLSQYMDVAMYNAKRNVQRQLRDESFMAHKLKYVTDSMPFRHVAAFFAAKPYSKYISHAGTYMRDVMRNVASRYNMPTGEMFRILDRMSHEHQGVKFLPQPGVPDVKMPMPPDFDCCPYPRDYICDSRLPYRTYEGSGNNPVSHLGSFYDNILPLPYRTYDGSCNNLKSPIWGRSMTPYKRLVPAVYGDGIESLRRSVVHSHPLPGPRTVSLRIFPDIDRPSNAHTLMLMMWSQFVDHDITRTAITEAAMDERGFGETEEVKCGFDGCEAGKPGLESCWPIPVPHGDPDFTNHRCLKFVRSQGTPPLACNFGPREQINQVTSWLDGSMIYGSTKEEAYVLRDFSDRRRGRMLVTPHPHGRFYKPLLPQDDVSFCRDTNQTVRCFRAGDERVNEQAGLTAMHTIWVREHNRVEQRLYELNPHWKGERLYQETRKIISAMVQHIVYKEQLPMLLGERIMKDYDLQLHNEGYYYGYTTKLDPRVANAFATAAYRFGHTLIQDRIRRTSYDFQHDDSLLLSFAFRRPAHIYDTSRGGVDSLVRGMCGFASQQYDHFFTKQITKSLFTEQPPFGPGMDLMSLNIQRGRDHGLSGYNAYRQYCGLRKAYNFDDLAHEITDPMTRHILSKVYKHVDDIDLFVGGISEKSVKGGMLGPTFACILAHQFQMLKKGDRFWYENDNEAGFTIDQLSEIRKVRLARIMCANGDYLDHIQPFVLLRETNERPFTSESAFYDKMTETHGINFNAMTSCDNLIDMDLTKWQQGPYIG